MVDLDRVRAAIGSLRSLPDDITQAEVATMTAAWDVLREVANDNDMPPKVRVLAMEYLTRDAVVRVAEAVRGKTSTADAG